MLIPFYLKKSPNCEGVMLDEIWLWNDTEWEFHHDFIQWLFPTSERSMFNPDAPLLTEEVVAEFHKDPRLRHNLRQSYLRWLRFCGITKEGGVLEMASVKKSVWGSFNHNWLRITRVLKSLTTLGLDKEAQEFYDFIKKMMADGSVEINRDTFAYWTDAIKRP